MKELCLTEEFLQQYVDGELAPEHNERAATHLASCAACTNLLREVEQETALLAEAFAPELSLSVPTARLRERLDAAIADLQPQRATASSTPALSSRVGAWLGSLASVFTPQRGLAFAGLAAVLVFAAIVAVIQLRQTKDANGTLAVSTGQEIKSGPQVAAIKESDQPQSGPTAPAPTPVTAEGGNRQKQRRSAAPKMTNTSSAVAATQTPQPPPTTAKPTKLLPGEKSYLEAIATLTTAIETNNVVTLKPTVRADFERNLAVVDQAIATTRMEAKRNPNDRDAAEFMYTAYQNKIELLSAVAYQGRASR